MEKIKPVVPAGFPLDGFFSTIKMMVSTFFRARVPIKPLSKDCCKHYDLIILAGPTWSYNPSGPVLSLIDRDGELLFGGKEIMPIISCRGYWRMHMWGLKKLLARCGAEITNHIVFSHPSPEPWRTLGVFLKIAGKNPERSGLIGKFYKRYGHSKAQMVEARRFGTMIGEVLMKEGSVSSLNFRTQIALP
ncbi:MAG: hypothetical protein KKA70_08850 [Proteobacteria bacterium]|nr:hypothetical protein [Pseudomonadota bacterium]